MAAVIEQPPAPEIMINRAFAFKGPFGRAEIIEGENLISALFGMRPERGAHVRVVAADIFNHEGAFPHPAERIGARKPASNDIIDRRRREPHRTYDEFGFPHRLMHPAARTYRLTRAPIPGP